MITLKSADWRELMKQILSHFKSQKITSWFELSYFSENDPSLVMDFLLESELCLEWAELHAIPTRAQHLIDSRYFMLLLQRDEPDLSTATKLLHSLPFETAKSICDSLLVQLTSLPSLKFVISLLLNCYTISLGPDDLEHYKMVQRGLPVPPPPSCRARLAVHGLVVPGASGCMACPLTLISDSCPCASAVHEPLALGSGLVRSELGIAVLSRVGMEMGFILIYSCVTEPPRGGIRVLKFWEMAAMITMIYAVGLSIFLRGPNPSRLAGRQLSSLRRRISRMVGLLDC
uniref:Uncharacterized protein n=1 Tax=Timema shepardi TaxID=629360 RepID=A0A7R9AUZ6_TIMSH|nr:unnamed protein product [Timema shepardi]